MLVDPDEHPSFYKLLFKEGSMDKILLPLAFIQENKNMLAKTCLLKTDEGVFWEAKIVREKRGFFICKGEWPQFVEYHKLELGDVLLFFLIDKSTFQVLPYKQKRYKNLHGRQVFEELSSSSKEDEDEEAEGEEEEVDGEGEGEEPPRISKKCKMQAIELSDNSAEESNDSSSKDGECPRYSHSGWKLKRRRERPRRDKDPDNPKLPTTAFFVFMEEFKKQFMKENPRIHSVYVVGRAGGEKWKQLSEADKAPYIAEAEKRKVEHQKNMRAYCTPHASGASKEKESDKSRSVVVKEDEGGRQLMKFPWMRILVRKHVISSARAVEEEEAVSGSEENGPKKIRSSMVNFNNKDPNFKVVVKKVTDTGQPLKTYLRRKYRSTG